MFSGTNCTVYRTLRHRSVEGSPVTLTVTTRFLSPFCLLRTIDSFTTNVASQRSPVTRYIGTTNLPSCRRSGSEDTTCGTNIKRSTSTDDLDRRFTRVIKVGVRFEQRGQKDHYYTLRVIEKLYEEIVR